MRTKRGAHLVPRSALGGEERAEARRRRTSRPARSSMRGHHLVAGDRVGHAVDRDRGDVGMAAEDALDRRGREVLAVDADPVGGAAGEVEDAVVVAVAEVARPVPAVATALGGRLGVVVVALEHEPRVAPHDLADREPRRSGSRPCSSNSARGHSTPVAGSTTATSAPAAGTPSAPGLASRTGVMMIAPSLEP